MPRKLAAVLSLAAAVNCQSREPQRAPQTANAVAAGPRVVFHPESLRVESDTIKGLPNGAVYYPLIGEHIAVEEWLGDSLPRFLVVSSWEPEGADYTGPVLLVLRPGEEVRWGPDGSPSPEYPGTVTNMHDSLMQDGRAFVGACRSSARELVQFVHYRPTDRSAWRDSTHVYAALGDSLLSVPNLQNLALASVLMRVAAGRCREIQPKAHTTPADEVFDDSL